MHNSGSDTISVLSAENDTKVGQDIEVAEGVWDMIVKPEDTAVYVSNLDTGGVSVIDGTADKVVARVSFAVNPSNGGQITCNKNMTSPLNQYIYVNVGTECKAEPIKGYEFSSWVEDLGSNSTRTIKPSTDEDNILKSFLDFFNIKTGDPAAALDVTEFGNFTANFNKLHPPLHQWSKKQPKAMAMLLKDPDSRLEETFYCQATAHIFCLAPSLTNYLEYFSESSSMITLIPYLSIPLLHQAY